MHCLMLSFCLSTVPLCALCVAASPGGRSHCSSHLWKEGKPFVFPLFCTTCSHNLHTIVFFLSQQPPSHSQVTPSLCCIIFVTAHNADLPSPLCLCLLQTSALFQSSIREGIKHYYDDLDFKNILDYVQQKVAPCCSRNRNKIDPFFIFKVMVNCRFVI